MKRAHSVSDSLPLAIMLAFSGGLMDAYSYLERGHVFANAQTGNIVLFSINLTTGNFMPALTYLLPVVAFAIGIALASLLRIHYRGRPRVHWRQIVVLIEALLFFCVAFIPQTFNLLANSLISFACGAQVESFRKVQNKEMGIATTMCIGNLRSGVQAICEYHVTKNKATLKRGLYAFTIIIGFALGAVVCGNLLLTFLQEKSILLSCALMLAAFCAMLIQDREYESENIVRD